MLLYAPNHWKVKFHSMFINLYRYYIRRELEVLIWGENYKGPTTACEFVEDRFSLQHPSFFDITNIFLIYKQNTFIYINSKNLLSKY